MAKLGEALGVLVVEDEMMVGMLLEDMLSELGHHVIYAASLDQAMQKLDEGGFDVAIVDLNLNGIPSHKVVEALMQRGTPIIIATGYGQRGVPEDYGSPPVLPKPFGIEDLKRALASLSL